MQDGKGLEAKYMYIASVVIIYWIISILTVFVNKTLLSDADISLDAPIFITWFQCIVSVVICIILNKCSKLFPKLINFPNGNPYERETIKKILPLSLLFTGMIITNNLCLKYVGVAFYYIGRSLTTVFNVILAHIILGQQTSFKCTLCCIGIISGFWLGVDQEHLTGSFSVVGTIYGVLGSITLSLYSIHTKKVLPIVNQNIWLLSYYNNVYAVFLFLPFMLISGEHQIIYNYNKIRDPIFWGTMFIGGICGFAIGYVTALQIKATSPLTHNVSGTAKACAQTLLATYWFNESKSFLWWTSNFIVLACSMAYARFRQLDLNKEYIQEEDKRPLQSEDKIY